MDVKLVAPEVDRLLRAFERGHVNASNTTAAVADAVEQLLGVLADLAPMEGNDEAKVLWIRVPRGTIDDYDDYEDMLGWGEVSNREEYEAMWREDYPDEEKWYRLVLVSADDFRGVAVDDRTVVSAWVGDGHGLAETDWLEEHKVCLLGLLGRAAGESMGFVRSGAYGREVESRLPYWQRKGVVRRADVWGAFPEAREATFEGMPGDVFERFRELVVSGAAERAEGRMTSMTAGDFLGACVLGYRACGYDLEGDDGAELAPAALYRRFADGRDEGLVGGGYGMHAGPGIDPDDPEAWDMWYFDRKRSGGHPWEVCRGGNSTHVALYVCHDRTHNEAMHQLGMVTDGELAEQRANWGYYFSVRSDAWNRAVESVCFYVAIHDAGLPVCLEDASAILARFEGRDYVGIVPHRVIPAYCADMFPTRFGKILDFTHVYGEDIDAYGDAIEWLPVEPARLVSRT